jgi:hypothetical protein
LKDLSGWHLAVSESQPADMLRSQSISALSQHSSLFHKGLDAQMLFYPFKEQFNLPSGLVDCGNGGRSQREIIR